MKKILFALMFIFCIKDVLLSAVLFDPGYEWRSIKTEHFWIHYHQNLDYEAKRLSIIAEKVHNNLKDKIRWEPYFRTDVILVDNQYSSNGFAIPIPSNRIQIYISRPELDGLLNNFDDWLELVFIHEYTHILNIDSIHGFPTFTRYTCGRVCFPNIFIPTWLLEGNAVYHESSYSIFGRNNSTYTDMIMRMEILSDSLKSIDKASHFPREWPLGRVPYIYGGLFVEFLEKKYGKGTIADVFIENSYNILPYYDNTIPYILPFIDSSDERVFKDTFVNLWDEWQQFIKIKYNKKIDEIRISGLTDYKQITKHGNRTTLPRYSSDGDVVYFIRQTNYNEPALMKYSLKDNNENLLCRVNDPNSLAISQNGDIYLSDAEYYRSFSIYNEAFMYNDKYEKLTNKLRGSYIDISKDGNRTVFIKQDQNRYSLMMSNRLFTEYESLISNSDIQLAFSRFSPDNDKIVFSMKDRSAHTDIAIFNIFSKEIQRLTMDKYNDINPAWHPDGKKIVFSSDRDGVYNLYEYNIEENTIAKITNLLGGAFSPDISPDGNNIAFALYHKNGFDIAIMKYPEHLKTNVNISKNEINSEEITNEASVDEEVTDKEADDAANIESENEKLSDKNDTESVGFEEEVADQDNDSAVRKIDSVNSGMMSIDYFKLKTMNNIDIVSYDYSVWNSIVPFLWIPVVASEEIYEDEYQWLVGIAFAGADTLLHHLYLASCLLHTTENRANIGLYYMYTGFFPNIILQYNNNSLFYADDEFPWKEDNQFAIKRTTENSGTIGVSIPINYFQSSHDFSFYYKYEKSYNDYYIPANFTHDHPENSTNMLAKITVRYSYSNAKSYAYSISSEDGRALYLISDIYSKTLGSDLSYTKLRGEFAEYLPGIFRNNVTMLRVRGGACFNKPDSLLSPYSLGRLEKGDIGIPSTDEDELGMRGYPSGLVYGNHIAVGTIEYRFPILQTDLGLLTFPIMLRDVWFTPFFEYGNVWDDSVCIEDFKSSAGIELSIMITIGYRLNIHSYVGYSRGFNENGEDQIYFAVSTLFEGALKNNYKWLDYL